MRTFLLVITFIVVILEAWIMKKEYNNQNLVGVVYWGFMMLMLFIALN